MWKSNLYNNVENGNVGKKQNILHSALIYGISKEEFWIEEKKTFLSENLGREYSQLD